MGQIEYGQENSDFDHGDQVIPVGKQIDQEAELEVEVDNLIRINSKKQQQQQQLGAGENDVLNAVHEQEEEELVSTNAGKEDENPKSEEDEHSLPSSSSTPSSDQKSVYFDETQGAVSSNGTNGTSEIGSPSAELPTAGKAPTEDELEAKVSDTNAENSLVNGTNLIETLENEVEQTPLENVNSSVKLVGNKRVQFGEVEEVEEVEVSNREETVEWDVERVIEEQETHDLICPNCKACITKRVILRKRKRSVPTTEIDNREPKKFGTPTKSILKPDSSSSSSNNHGHYAAEPGLGAIPDTNERRDDVFRCFSCFSFFIPTVAGFRLFRCFGFDNEESILVSQPTPSPNQGKVVDEVTPAGKKTANADDVIPSLATTFPFLEPAHGNAQLENAIGKAEVEKQNIVISPLQGAATTMEEIQRDTTENHMSGSRDIDGGELPGYSDTSEEVGGKGIVTLSENDALLLRDRRDGIGGAEGVPIKSIAGGDLILNIVDAAIGSGGSPSVQINIVPAAPLVSPVRGTVSLPIAQGSVTATRSREWDILKSIVYGGLVEAITSLGVVSSAAGADATTLNIVALGMASLVSGLLVIIHALGELKSDQHERVSEVEDEKVGRYEELLGRRHNFPRHAIVAVLSYLVCGLLPPITYGFSFRNSNNKDYKMLSVAAVSLICIILLAIGRAHTRRPRSNSSYIKSTLYFVSIGLAASGLSFVLGEVLMKLLEKFAVLEPNAAFSPPPPSSSFLLGQTIPSMAKSSAWASY